VARAILAHRQGDQLAFDPLYARLRTAWTEHHPVRILLTGLHEDLSGKSPAAKVRFLAFLDDCKRVDWSLKTLGERRTTSVNLYHMAEVLGRHGDPAAARSLLDEAEKLHPGKRKVALKDPLLKRLSPERSP
jgi:hypothetical protein